MVSAMWGALATTLLLFTAEGPRPSSPPACPDPDEVAAQLTRLGVKQEAQPTIEVTGDKMRVMLRGQAGATLGSREVEAPASCHERATVAAVLVATWMGVWPEAPAPVPTPPRQEPAQPDRTSRASFGLSFLTAVDGNGFAFGAAAETFIRLHGPLHMALALSAASEREQSIGPARVGYRRPAIAVGPVLALGRARVRWQLGASGQVGMLLMRGKGLATVHETISATFGAGAFARVLLAGERFSPFLDLGAVSWFVRQRATLDDAPDTAQLPLWDAHLALGVSFSP